MKIHVIGVKRVKGTSSKTGNDFDMCRLFGMVPITAGGSAKTSVSGFGFEVAEMELDPEAIDTFAKVSFPAMLDLETDSRPFMGKFETVVVGYKGPAVKAAA